MSLKTYLLYCEPCNWKRITDGSDVQDLVEIKRSPIPGGYPKLDPVTKKVIKPKPKKQPRQFKCPGCGRGILPKKIPNPQAAIDQKLEEENRGERIAQAEAEQEKKLQKVIEQATEKSEKRRKEFEEKVNPFDGSEAGPA